MGNPPKEHKACLSKKSFAGTAWSSSLNEAIDSGKEHFFATIIATAFFYYFGQQGHVCCCAHTLASQARTTWPTKHCRADHLRGRRDSTQAPLPTTQPATTKKHLLHESRTPSSACRHELTRTTCPSSSLRPSPWDPPKESQPLWPCFLVSVLRLQSWRTRADFACFSI